MSQFEAFRDPAALMPEADSVRFISVDQLDAVGVSAQSDLDELARSIQRLGILRPLIVRDKAGRYEIIAGRRRYSAAQLLGLSEIPCIVIRDADDARANALAAADNIHSRPVSGSVRANIMGQVSTAISDVSRGVSDLVKSLSVLPDMRAGFERETIENLVRAQAWRTLWMANVTSFLCSGQVPDGRRRAFAAVVDSVVDGFEPERRVTGIRFDVAHAATRAIVDDSLVGLAIAGAVIVTLSFVRSVRQPTLWIRTSRGDDSHVVVDVTQRHAAISPELSFDFGSPRLPENSSPELVLGALALAHATAAYGGASQLVRLDDVGSTLQLTFTIFDS